MITHPFDTDALLRQLVQRIRIVDTAKALHLVRAIDGKQCDRLLEMAESPSTEDLEIAMEVIQNLHDKHNLEPVNFNFQEEDIQKILALLKLEPDGKDKHNASLLPDNG